MQDGCDDAGGVGVSVRPQRCGEQSGDDGTEDQRVRETRDIEIREFFKSGIMIRQAEEGPMKTLAQVGDPSGQQDRGDGKDGRRGCDHNGIVQRCFQSFWKEEGLTGRVLVLREEVTSSLRLPQETERPRRRTVEGFEERRQQRKRATRRSSRASAISVARQVTGRRIAGPWKRVPSCQAKKAWQRRGASTWRASI